LEYGRLAADLANYYLTSEQTPTSFNLSVKFDTAGNVTGAGGLILQVLPNAAQDITKQLESLVQNLPSIGEAFETGLEPDVFITTYFHDFFFFFLGSGRVEFFCPCRKETVGNLIAQLPMETLDDMVQNDPFPIETTCHNCNTIYSFAKDEIESFRRQKHG